ncbi:MAG TPA: Hsp33 family molecular chaperone HslO [Rhodocyclaceae bacterium]|nr:Hsp33 family molecular chaperone HslO [Rhodocyclaceae bacterium]
MDAIHRFLLEDLDIRGALVQLGPAWEAMHRWRNYAAPVRNLLGELAAVAAVIGGNLKSSGRLTLQLQGHGPVSLLLMDCDDQLRMRGMARSELADEATIRESNAAALAQPELTTIRHLLGDGRLVLSLYNDTAGEPYQSLVPLVGDSLAALFEHYLLQSEQQPARLWLAATEETACGLFLQKLPDADMRDSDGWRRIEQLADTVRPDELTLAPEVLLTRLFGTEKVRLFASRPIALNCPRNEEKVRDMLLTLGREELENLLEDAEIIAIEDEICGHKYLFGPEIIDELFPPEGRILH